MGLFSRSAPGSPTTLDIRADLKASVDKTPSRVSKALLSGKGPEILQHLSERIPQDETVQDVAPGSDNMATGCLVLTERRFIVCTLARDRGASAQTTALKFGDITALNFNKLGVPGMPGCAAVVDYGTGRQLSLIVGGDTTHALTFLGALRDHVNGSGRYGI